MIFEDKESMNSKSSVPRCVSAVMAKDVNFSKVKLDGKRIYGEGIVYDFEELKKEDREFIPRRIISGRIISNFCLGDKVFLIKRLNIVSGNFRIIE